MIADMPYNGTYYIILAYYLSSRRISSVTCSINLRMISFVLILWPVRYL